MTKKLKEMYKFLDYEKLLKDAKQYRWETKSRIRYEKGREANTLNLIDKANEVLENTPYFIDNVFFDSKEDDVKYGVYCTHILASDEIVISFEKKGEDFIPAKAFSCRKK